MSQPFKPSWSRDYDHERWYTLADSVVVWFAWDEEWDNDESDIVLLEAFVSRGSEELFHEKFGRYGVPFDPNSISEVRDWALRQSWTSAESRRAAVEEELAKVREVIAHHTAQRKKYLAELTQLLENYSANPTKTEQEVVALCKQIADKYSKHTYAADIVNWNMNIARRLETRLAQFEPEHVRDLRSTLFPT